MRERSDVITEAKKFGRRARPRAKSVDSQCQSSGTDNATFEIARSSENIAKQFFPKNNEYDESDQLTPLVYKSKKTVKIPSNNRSYSLDSDPHYQFVLYGTSCSFLTGGLSKSIDTMCLQAFWYERSIIQLVTETFWFLAGSMLCFSQQCAITLKPCKQNSIVTIFAIWNTIIGSSLLAMPWSVQKAGLAVALILMLFVSTLAVYTAYRLLTVQFIHGDNDVGEVPFLCKKLLGKWAELTSRIFSFIIIFGANVVYWILMSNCLYHSVGYLIDILFGVDMDTFNGNNTVLCPSNSFANATAIDEEKTLFQKIWNLEVTVPIFLIVIVTPLLNFKSASFFTKFNSIGTLSVIYLLIFVMTKSISWGINVDLSETTSEHYVNLYETTFFATSGMLPLSLFIHNIVITLMRNNRDQKNNSRDLSIAYILVVLTYLLIGFTFYICFPLKKSCIEDNMLNNFPDWDIMTVTARIFLFFQLLTVYPLLSYMLRIQIFSALNYPSYPNAFYVMILNSFNVIGCVLFAIFLPRIGTIIRFTGAICGFVYIFTLPCLLYIASRRQQNKLKLSSIALHILIPIVGLINLTAQFFVSDSSN